MALVVPEPQPPLNVAVDMHLHVSMSQGAKPIFRGEAGSVDLAESGSTRLFNQIDEPKLNASGLRLALGALWPPYNLRPGRTRMDEAVHQLQAQLDFGHRQPGFAVVHSAAQARTALAHGRIAIFPALEGGEGIESVEDVDRLWASGLRAITLVHFASSQLGGAARGQTARNIFGIHLEGLEPMGLTPLGKEVVERMISLGILIDLAHASDAFTRDVLDVTEPRGVPVVNSHSPARALIDMERAISDASAARIAKSGGLVGVTVFNTMVANVPEAERWPGFVPGTCDEIVAHWLYLAKVTGPDALTLGSDFNGFITRHPPGGSCPHGLRNVGDLPELFAALQAHGVPREALDGMGARFLAVVEKVEAHSDPKAKAQASRLRTFDTDLFDAP
jgi:membrane dipeptidase